MPGAIIFSKSFLSFSKNIESAMTFINKENKNNNLSKAFLELENDNYISYDLSTHADIEKYLNIQMKEKYYFFLFHLLKLKKLRNYI